MKKNKDAALIKAMKLVLLYVLFFVGAIVVVCIPTLIPRDRVISHVEEAYEMMEKEGLYPTFYNNNLAFLDNYTDAIYLNIMITQSSENVLEEGVANFYYSRDEDADETMIDGLRYAIDQEGYTKPYSNFWLGNIILLKFLLVFLKYGQIRYLLYLVAGVLLIVCFSLLRRYTSPPFAYAFVLAQILHASLFNTASLQFSTDYIMLDIFVIIILLYNRYVSDLYKRICLFSIMGMLQFFKGFCESPMIVVGASLVLCLYFEMKNGERAGHMMKNILISALSWLIGYGVMGLGKQVLSILVLGDEIGLGKIAHWTSASDVGSRILAFITPMKSFFIRPVFLAVLVIAVLLLISLFKNKSLNLELGLGRHLLLMIIPFVIDVVWFSIMSSAVGHGWYCQNYYPVTFAGLYLLLSGVWLFKTNESGNVV